MGHGIRTTNARAPLRNLSGAHRRDAGSGCAGADHPGSLPAGWLFPQASHFAATAYLDSGFACIAVLEWRFSEARIEAPARDVAAPYFEKLSTVAPTKLSDLRLAILRAQNMPGLSVRARIALDADDVRAHRLIVDARLKKVEGYLELSGRGPSAVGPLQAVGETRFKSVFNGGDQLPRLPALDYVQGFAFWDARQTWFTGNDASYSLASSGVGARFGLFERYSLGLVSAKPLTRTPFGDRDKEWRRSVTLTA
jgi:hypothetical protein